ncbi:MAG: AMP-binding protein [Pseudomonadota bacterium]
MMGLPAFWRAITLSTNFCRSMRLFISGSAPLLDETFRAFEQEIGHAILERYGMTETGMLCSNPLNGERKPGIVGPPLADVEVRVADKQGSILDQGGVGVLEVCEPDVFRRLQRLSADAGEDRRRNPGSPLLHHRDISRIDQDGYVRIVRRAKGMIISAGFKVPKAVFFVDELPRTSMGRCRKTSCASATQSPF